MEIFHQPFVFFQRDNDGLAFTISINDELLIQKLWQGSFLSHQQTSSSKVYRNLPPPPLQNPHERPPPQLLQGQPRPLQRLLFRDRPAVDGAQEVVEEALAGGGVVEDLADQRGLGGLMNEIAQAVGGGVEALQEEGVEGGVAGDEL